MKLPCFVWKVLYYAKHIASLPSCCCPSTVTCTRCMLTPKKRKGAEPFQTMG